MTRSARRLLGGLAYFVPRLKKIWADAAYRGKQLADWCLQQGDGWDLEVVERQAGTRGFSIQPRRWVVERRFAWLIRNRRLAKDYERKVQTSETLIQLAVVRLLLRRLACRNSAQGHPHDRPFGSDHLIREAGDQSVHSDLVRVPDTLPIQFQQQVFHTRG